MSALWGTTQMVGQFRVTRELRVTGHSSSRRAKSTGQVPVRDLAGDEVLGALLERLEYADGGLRLTCEGSMLGDLIKAVLSSAPAGELSAHLGYEKHDPAGNNSGNFRNDAIRKTAQTGIGPVHLAVPRDRAGTFEPVLVPKRADRISGGLDMIISRYAA
jgi:putative transposase